MKVHAACSGRFAGTVQEETMEQKPPVSSNSPNFPPPSFVQHEVPQRRKHRQWLWILILLLIFAGIFYFLLHKSGNQKAATGPGPSRMFGGAVTLTAATAKTGDIGVYLNNLGTVTPVKTATIYNQVTGVVTAVYYHEGQFVRQGQPLVEIDPRQYQANVDTATGNLERDSNLLAQAQMDLARYQAAWARNAIARQTLEDQEKLVQQDQGLVQADKGTLEFDKVQLSYCHITAPFTGKVGLRLIDPGNLVQASASTPLVVVTQIDPITVVFPLPEGNLEQVLKQLRAGHALTVEAWDASQSQKLGLGRLTALDNQIDTTTGTVKLRATFSNSQGILYPNQFVNTRLLVDTERNETLIPSQAIQHNGQEAFVFLIVNGKKPNVKIAKLHDVTEGVSNQGMTAVAGVKPGDVVATSSFEKLRDGSEVHIVKAQPESSSNESSAP